MRVVMWAFCRCHDKNDHLPRLVLLDLRDSANASATRLHFLLFVLAATDSLVRLVFTAYKLEKSIGHRLGHSRSHIRQHCYSCSSLHSAVIHHEKLHL